MLGRRSFVGCGIDQFVRHDASPFLHPALQRPQVVRNLATLTRLGAIAPMESAWACQRLNAIGNPMTTDYAIIHPINVLTTSELSLHRCPAVKARRMATPSNSGHSVRWYPKTRQVAKRESSS